MASVESTSDNRIVNNTMRHQYRILNDAEKANMQNIKDKGLEFHELVSGLGNSREKFPSRGLKLRKRSCGPLRASRPKMYVGPQLGFNG